MSSLFRNIVERKHMAASGTSGNSHKGEVPSPEPSPSGSHPLLFHCTFRQETTPSGTRASSSIYRFRTYSSLLFRFTEQRQQHTFSFPRDALYWLLGQRVFIDVNTVRGPRQQRESPLTTTRPTADPGIWYQS